MKAKLFECFEDLQKAEIAIDAIAKLLTEVSYSKLSEFLISTLWIQSVGATKYVLGKLYCIYKGSVQNEAS